MSIFTGLFSGRKTEPPAPSSPEIYIINPPVAGVYVDEHVALTYSAVWGCVRAVSETFAYMPWRAYKNENELRKIATDHPADYLLHRRPNPEMSACTFKEVIESHALLWGNGYAEIEFSRLGEPLNLWLLTPDTVTPKRDGNRRLYYEIRGEYGDVRKLPASNIFHLKGLGFNGLQGYSVVDLARESISAGLATRQFASSFFGNNAVLAGVIEKAAGSGKKLSDDAVDNLLKTFNRKHQGAKNANKVKYLDEGLTYKQIGVPPEQAQFLESRKFEVTEICRWFRVPPHKLADLERATFSNIEQQDIQFVVDSILPWVTRAEQEADIKLFQSDRLSLYFTKMNVKSLMRGDSQSRATYYQILFNIGVYSVNEIRKYEDENPIGPEGDIRLVPMNMMSLSQAHKQGSSKSAPGPEVIKNAHVQIFTECAQRIANKEFSAVSRLAKSHKSDIAGFTSSMEDFYAKNDGQFLAAFDTSLSALAELVMYSTGRELNESIVEDATVHCKNVIESYLERSQTIYKAAAEAQEFNAEFETLQKTTRPGRLALDIVERVTLYLISQGSSENELSN